ncbi:uncharacterized protein BO88DRAFT_342612 [Aspergillus vadensis CBS 113365]|uniref:PD-(D/E)XK nuclease-like domain-containing protein n=1 Tax=Aspergillus vadensis (strain CBS 113365 / IMI 142717 / IBT 24658) TaxID=1448311 RepID=A0A319B641_ASPVC|nr:hypothetical protein BO88DRAFT_342612 [Aspergillus vadensis CBS 113365]PYH68277.1 hypothetical protein BO88DRAFT_342612 [Aspergillus vadensis CBS 113365]
MAGEWFRRTPARENIEANDREEAGQVRTEDESIGASRTEFCESDESLPLSESSPGIRRRFRIVTDLIHRLIEARPRIVFRAHYIAPDSNHVYGLIHFLKHGEPAWTSDGFELEMSKVISACYRCVKEERSKGSWVMDYVRPLLDLAIDDLPLDSWSVQAEPVRDKYLPANSARGMFNHKVDLVVGLPKEPWKESYTLAGIDIPDRELSHIEHAHTGKRLLGLGVKVKGFDGTRAEARVQLGVWMAGLMSWAHDSYRHVCPDIPPPPVIGCTVVGSVWRFYIIYAMGCSSGKLRDVYIWGPIPELEGDATSRKRMLELVITLNRVMQYIRWNYAPQMFGRLVLND